MIGSLPACGGTYVLVMRLEHTRRLRVGGLGLQVLPAGWYCYVGSALGPGGLRARLGHHASVAARPHWHVDHLRRYADLSEIWYTANEIRREHDYAALLENWPGNRIPVAGFGASDCRCNSHLFCRVERPDPAVFLCSVAECFPTDEVRVVAP